jgi:(1->4)-alpha-D-glucan 1-alpha-D-glucosylmutase
MEDPVVFEETHELIFRLLRDRAVRGLRIDHVDGLYDPADYLRRLQAHAREAGLEGADRPLFLVVEKILAAGEPLPSEWPVDGTTGYEFAAMVNGLFVEAGHERAMDALYRRFTKEHTAFADLAYTMKKLIMTINMASEINLLAHQLNEFSERNRHYRDFTLNSLVQAIREIIACFPVYRTYVPGGSARVGERDRVYIERAVDEAARRNPTMTLLVFDFIRDLLLKRADYIPEEQRGDYLRFVARFQQITSPVTAKGIEDTALYRYNRLVSLNEVGSDPSRFGAPPAAVHDWMAERQRAHPTGLSATSTHDTKRSEDVRARIDVLSEIPAVWRAAVGRWSRINRRHHRTVDGVLAPDRNEEYLLYQTLVGAWPLEAIAGLPSAAFVDRIVAYMTKALREAKRHSSWLNPRHAWEEAVTAFVRGVLDAHRGAAFLADLHQLLPRVVHAGLWNSLAQTVIKIAAPGVPDFYQGTELWNFSLVDPDNRGPVDYERRRRLLEQVQSAGADLDPDRARDLLDARFDGRLKLHVIAAGLRFRRAHDVLFRTGDYVPLDVTGARAAHVFAFARVHGRDAVIAVTPRLTTTLVPEPSAPPIGDVWGDTCVNLTGALGERQWANALTCESVAADGSARLAISDVLGRLPVAVLASR